MRQSLPQINLHQLDWAVWSIFVIFLYWYYLSQYQPYFLDFALGLYQILFQQRHEIQMKKYPSRKPNEEVSTVLNILTVGSKNKIRFQQSQESQMKKVSSVLNNILNRHPGKSVLARALKTHRFHSTYVGIVRKTFRRPTLSILPTYKNI